MKKYVAKRDNVYAGTLIKKIVPRVSIIDEEGQEFTEDKFAELGITNFQIQGGLICRGMLFKINKNNLAEDLVYENPTDYNIEGIEPKLDLFDEFVITEYAKLEELLKYLKYGEDLTQEDMNQIYRRFLVHGWWLKRHLELFGYKKIPNGYASEGEEVLPQDIADTLTSINLTKATKPHPEEPFHKLIYKRKGGNKT